MPSNTRITQAQRELDEARENLDRIVREEQKSCDHRHIGECDHQLLSHGFLLPPVRVCSACGLSEEGWGYRVLDDGPADLPLHERRSIVKVKREELYKLRAGLRLTDKHSGPLLRGEVTVVELIDQGNYPKSQQEQGISLEQS